MAIELCPESSAGVSPRISFSHDLCVPDIVPFEQRLPLRSGSLGNIDFDFCAVRKSFDSSSADELFSDGKILPTEIKKKTASAKQMDSSVPSRQVLQDDVSSDDSLKKDRLKEMKSSSNYEAEDQKQSSKSFWRFKRSSSLNCASGYGRSLCHLPLLSRSYSAGSTPRSKRAPLTKDTNHKQNKQAFFKSSQSSSTKNYQKPPLKKNYGPYGNGVRVSPVLNVPSGNLFGLGSIFFNGKDKKNMKK